MRVIENFSVFLHNCDAIRDYHCIQIYKDLLLVLSRINWKLDRKNFRWLDGTEKRARLQAIIAYLTSEGMVFVDPSSGRLEFAGDKGQVPPGLH
jgi:hypothetical protein